VIFKKLALQAETYKTYPTNFKKYIVKNKSVEIKIIIFYEVVGAFH
jgi:hypothetical protein